MINDFYRLLEKFTANGHVPNCYAFNFILKPTCNSKYVNITLMKDNYLSRQTLSRQGIWIKTEFQSSFQQLLCILTK